MGFGEELDVFLHLFVTPLHRPIHYLKTWDPTHLFFVPYCGRAMEAWLMSVLCSRRKSWQSDGGAAPLSLDMERYGGALRLCKTLSVLEAFSA